MTALSKLRCAIFQLWWRVVQKRPELEPPYFIATDMAQIGKYKDEEKLVISMDVGTTHSAVSYAYLYPNSVPEVRMVTKWAGQPEAMGDSKIPTILAYRKGALVACGAEARDFVGDDDYEVARWFKLLLHPDSMKISDAPPAYDSETSTSIEIPPLPVGVALKQVYADFLRYLFNATKNYFEDNTPNGSQIWSRLADDMTIVLAVPNGWDITQQGFLKAAAIHARLVTQASAETRLEFVTEGESSVHYVLAHQRHQWPAPGTAFLVVDAGGSTVDSTLYRCEAVDPKLVLKEMCASECVQAGGVFVDHAARGLLRKKLDSSQFSEDEYLDNMIGVFERNTKRTFNGSQESNVIQFGSSRDNGRTRDIIKGRISLSRVEVQAAFEVALSRIFESVRMLEKGRGVQHVLLVGEFGEAPYLRSRLREYFAGKKTEVVTVDEPSKKAAAEGASIWHIKQLVMARIARVTLGVSCNGLYKPRLPDHRARQHHIVQILDGSKRVRWAFETWIEKGSTIEHDFSKSFGYHILYKFRPTAEDIRSNLLSIYVWEGVGSQLWTHDTNAELIPGMRELCSLQVDAAQLIPLAQQYFRVDGEKYWRLDYQVVVHYNGTRLMAKMQWNDNGRVCYGPVSIIPGHEY